MPDETARPTGGAHDSDGAPATADSSAGGGRAKPRSRRRRVLTVVGVVFLALVLVAGTAFALAYRKLDGNISSIDATPLLGPRPEKTTPHPEEPEEPLNILLMGSDSREGKGNHYGGDVSGARSDTTILLHISADRKSAYGVSLPRDAMVQRPNCRTAKGDVVPGAFDMFNAAYSVAGPACTIKMVEHLTGVYIDHFVVVDFHGFKTMVDALGGVTVCVPTDVNDDVGHIQLKAGTYEVTGDKALDYVRVRHVLSDNGDIGRMKRQQVFLASMASKATSLGMLARPDKLYSFLDAATKSVTTDPDLASLGALAGLARELNGIGAGNIQFVTVPFKTYAPDPNRLAWKTKQANSLWKRIINDEPLKKTPNDEVISANDVPGGGGNGGGRKPTKKQQALAAENGLCS